MVHVYVGTKGSVATVGGDSPSLFAFGASSTVSIRLLLEGATLRLLTRKSFLLGSFCAISMLGLAGCGSGKLQEADDLFENEEYAEALAIYDGFETTEEIEEKKSQCRFWLFIEYLRDEGGVDSSTHDFKGNYYETSVEASKNGDIRIFYHEYTVVSGPDTSNEYVIDISREEGTADVSGIYELTDPSSGTAKQTGTGSFDIGNYTYGDSMAWDSTTDAVTLHDGTQSALGMDVISSTSGTVVGKAIETLVEVVEDSDTGCTMADIGFTNLDSVS